MVRSHRSSRSRLAALMLAGMVVATGCSGSLLDELEASPVGSAESMPELDRATDDGGLATADADADAMALPGDVPGDVSGGGEPSEATTETLAEAPGDAPLIGPLAGLPRTTLDGIEITGEATVEDWGEGPFDAYSLRAQGPEHLVGVALPQRHIPRGRLDIVTWAGSGDTMIYVLDVPPTANQVLVTVGSDVVDTIPVEPGNYVVTASGHGASATVLTVFDGNGVELGRCGEDPAEPIVMSCRPS